MKYLGVFALALILFNCSAYRRSTERYFTAVTKREFKRFEASTNCQFDYKTPQIVPIPSASYWNPFSKVLFYEENYPSQIVHELSHSYLSPADRGCLTELVAQLIYENYQLNRKLKFMELENR